MIILGLAGPAGAGKDAVADHLVRAFGFVKFAFSDAIYREVQDAYGLEDQSPLRDRPTKEFPTERLALENCMSDEFVGVAVGLIPAFDRHPHCIPLSPRQVLQWWGTDYRRAQDKNYWLDRAGSFIAGLRDLHTYPEQAPQYFVETGTRFENERAWIHNRGGNVWHIHRDGTDNTDEHASAGTLMPFPGERELWNNGSIERLHRGVDLMMTNQVRFVRVEAMNSIVALKPDGVTLAGGEEPE